MESCLAPRQRGCELEPSQASPLSLRCGQRYQHMAKHRRGGNIADDHIDAIQKLHVQMPNPKRALQIIHSVVCIHKALILLTATHQLGSPMAITIIALITITGYVPCHQTHADRYTRKFSGIPQYPLLPLLREG